MSGTLSTKRLGGMTFKFGFIPLRRRAYVTVQQIVWEGSVLVIPLFSLSPLSRGASHQSRCDPGSLGRSSLSSRPLQVFTACGLLDYYVVWPSLLYIYILYKPSF